MLNIAFLLMLNVILLIVVLLNVVAPKNVLVFTKVLANFIILIGVPYQKRYQYFKESLLKLRRHALIIIMRICYLDHYFELGYLITKVISPF
jgi:hypothetical protein